MFSQVHYLSTSQCFSMYLKSHAPSGALIQLQHLKYISCSLKPLLSIHIGCAETSSMFEFAAHAEMPPEVILKDNYS